MTGDHPPPAGTSYDDIAHEVSHVGEDEHVERPALPGPLALLDKVVEVAGVLALGTIVVLVIVNAGGRYLFSRPLVWTEEIVATLLIWVVMIGAYLALERGQMIASTAILDRFALPVRKAIVVVANALAAVTFAFIAHVGWQYFGLFGSDKTPYFGFPKGVYIAALPLAAAAMALVAVGVTVYKIRRLR
ncbi:TRAP transporter small permease [Acuticoccus sp. I52.16.1]|uniref:TRAP transporter small permease n=1 Tax=Acuticoccus sp. I52.16.1 TaxID=2928472 RepID=UPI001FD179FC|nr:TRAP transporter small permease subunit [Acuticoccus sp. I52.16.1]UOM32979.1 TRAP transporter small permease subunit [Acuticoccus sp. I52.16.1]